MRIVLRSPFSSEPLALSVFTDRAVSLVPVLPVKRMAAFAGCFLGIYVRYGIAVLHRIFVRRDALKMLGINAARVSARVIDYHTGLNGAVHGKPCHSMGPSVFPSEMEGPIPILVKSALPNMTALAVDDKFGAKSFSFLVSEVHINLLMALKGKWSSGDSQYGMV